MKNIKRLLSVLLAAVLLVGCQGEVPLPAATDPTTAPTPASQAATIPLTTPEPTTPEPTTPAPTTLPPETMPPFVATAVPSGVLVKSNDQAVIDHSNASHGYVMACYTASTQRRLKAQVKGKTTYTFNLTPGTWAAFPLAEGDGKYKVSIYENVTGSKYALVLSHTIDVTLADEFAPFLHSNQFVNYDAAPQTVAKAWELCGHADALEKVELVYHYVVEGMEYDYDLAASVKSGYVPELDKVLDKQSGICFDYAALMTGMLRSQGVPCKLVVGYAGDIYHAWISVWTEETGWVEGMVFFDGHVWKRMDPTFASSAHGDREILDYITNDRNYTAKYIY